MNDAIRDFINLACYIDTPLDIAMARRILRNAEEQTMHDLQSNLQNYLIRGRAAYLEMEKTVKASSDIIIQGDLVTDLIVDRIIEELRKSAV
ncbi:Uridine kinase [Paenibacillus allorhizoplanae]|uniref:Uridine kinase n=1 Tax=Paenibacillus allorhizoplanae TaxID=2905648 RepID=A0ABM9CGJ7_9BACL|nr:Uridine kinase [Paenibacillus allorhizoplanae]